MVLQTFAIVFNYNASMTFTWIESKTQTLNVFKSWFEFMNDFKKDFEWRRNILGLTSILACGNLP